MKTFEYLIFQSRTELIYAKRTNQNITHKPATHHPLPTSKPIPILFAKGMDKKKLPTIMWIWGG
jgi:hypothetical protein